jgi:hypothetical protein
LSSDFVRIILEDFLESSQPCIRAIVQRLHSFKEDEERKVEMIYRKNDQMTEVVLDGPYFFLRSSVEYSNPQLTVEEVQGIVVARLLEVCGNYFNNYSNDEYDRYDLDEICEWLSNPPLGKIVSFLLNTDDIEPDRYSMNPLKTSIMKSGQSAYPVASVKTEELKIDTKFMEKYKGSLISKDEGELIKRHLETDNNNYMDMVDAIKYEQLKDLSNIFGINLCLPSIRMPLTVLKKEKTDGLLHHIIKESHKDYDSIQRIYNFMGRSMKKRTTLLTVPHSNKGYGSKRSAKGKILFQGTKLKSVKITYRTKPLYPNAIDPNDISIAKADDHFVIEGDKLTNYKFCETPSSPQFILYSLGSPEDAVIWHGIGAFGALQLVKSYTSTRSKYAKDLSISNLKKRHEITPKIPLQFNLIPKNMWVHPVQVHDNIDTSIGCIENLEDLAKMGMKLEVLPTHEYIR